MTHALVVFILGQIYLIGLRYIYRRYAPDQPDPPCTPSRRPLTETQDPRWVSVVLVPLPQRREPLRLERLTGDEWDRAFRQLLEASSPGVPAPREFNVIDEDDELT